MRLGGGGGRGFKNIYDNYNGYADGYYRVKYNNNGRNYGDIDNYID